MKIFNEKTDKILGYTIEILAVISALFLAFTVNRSNNIYIKDLMKSDIFYEYSAGVDISNGINPYQKIVGNSLIVNDKYATLFPLYYYFLLAITFISNFSFSNFIETYRIVIFIAECAAFAFVYLQFRKKNMKLVGFAAASFLILNRWTLNTVTDAKQDVISIAFLMGSLYFFDSKRRLAYLLYGFSLAIKHLGIFLFPLYLAPLILGERKLKDFVIDCLYGISPILIPSLPFIFDNVKGFVLSLLFSFTRAPASSSSNPLYGYEHLLVLYGSSKKAALPLLFLPRLPLIGFYGLSMVLLFTKKIPRYVFALFALFCFITFNPVYFDQYMLWVTPFVLFAVSEYVSVEGLSNTSKQ